MRLLRIEGVLFCAPCAVLSGFVDDDVEDVVDEGDCDYCGEDGDDDGDDPFDDFILDE